MDDVIFLSHILEETEFLISLTSTHDIEIIISDPILSRAVRSSLETIGEAAKNLSQTFRNDHSEIFWRGIIGMRDRLIHHYFGIDWDLVIDVLNDEIPRLHSDFTFILRSNNP
jgi:uncharacterized protein with HEPN domain